MIYHVHIYQVASQGEVNIEAKDKNEAMEKALDMAKEGSVSLRFPDCGQIAIPFELGYENGKH